MGAVGRPSCNNFMPTKRPNLMLDEQAFQDMLAAAFTIQEHNAQRKKQAAEQHSCGRCGAAVEEGVPLCPKCADAPRQGEELQRKWASLWLMSQEQGLGPESFSSAVHEDSSGEAANHELMVRRFPEALEIPEQETEVESPAEVEEDADGEESSAMVFPAATGLRAAEEPAQLEAEVDPAPVGTVDEAAAAPGSLRDLRLRLRFHRADFYLVVAVAVSTVAMVWVLSATPALGTQRKPRLKLWERAMISLGLAEAPEPPPKRGNPNLSVWVDPKTALYYCVGEELYGKAPGGHLATQREAQLDQFEPASRAACE